MELKIGMKFHALGEWERTFKLIGLDDQNKTVYIKRDEDGQVFKLKQYQVPRMIQNKSLIPMNFKLKEA